MTLISNSNRRQIAAMVTNAGLQVGGKTAVKPAYASELAKGASLEVNAVAWGAGGLMILISSSFAYLSAFTRRYGT